MIIAIRIAGMVNVNKDIQESLFRLRLRRKYSAVLLKPKPETIKLLQHLRDFIAYGDISKETLKELIIKRGMPVKKGIRINADQVTLDLEKKDLESIGLKPFFRLHPPRGGADTKVHFPIRKGVLGDHKDKINLLVRRML